MSANTANRGYTYPQSTDDVRPYEDIQELAQDVDTDVDTIVKYPICHLVQQTAQTGWTSATYTGITFSGAGAEVVDTHNCHADSPNPSRIVIGNKLGWWEISGIFIAASNTATTLHRAVLRKNGVDLNGSFCGTTNTSNSNINGIVTPTILVEATASSDNIEIYGWVTAASGTIGTAVSSAARSSLTAKWLRPS